MTMFVRSKKLICQVHVSRMALNRWRERRVRAPACEPQMDMKTVQSDGGCYVGFTLLASNVLPKSLTTIICPAPTNAQGQMVVRLTCVRAPIANPDSLSRPTLFNLGYCAVLSLWRAAGRFRNCKNCSDYRAQRPRAI